MKRLIITLLSGFTVSASAQPGIDEMHQASQQLSSDFFSAFNCSLVLAGILAIIGALRIYHNLNMGKKDFVAEVAAWFFAAIFMVLAGAFVKALFGI